MNFSNVNMSVRRKDSTQFRNTLSLLQAAIHYHLPYSSLYGRINRLKREQAGEWSQFRDFEDPDIEDNESSNGGMEFK